MKRCLFAGLTAISLVCRAWSAEEEPTLVSNLALEGKLDGENITFTMTFDVDVRERHARLPLVVGDVAYLEGDLPRKSELLRENDQYVLKLNRKGKWPVRFTFASRAVKDGEWRRTRFEIPGASTRKVSVLCDREDLEIAFPGALDVTKEKAGQGQKRVTAFLGAPNRFEVGWRPEVRKLDKELVVTCDVNTIVTAGVGALRTDTVLTYRMIQGALDRVSLKVPDVNVTQVRGDYIQDWRIDKTQPEAPRLLVTIGRRVEGTYRLQIESELVLPPLPCKIKLPVFAPENTIRSSGFLMLGTDSAVRLRVDKAAGITQVDQEAFPAVTMGEGQARVRPARSLYAYQYANTPSVVELVADDIMPSVTADDRTVVTFADNELTFSSSVEIDVKDAPLREIVFATDADATWTVTGVTGRQVAEADTDVRDEAGKRTIRVPFKQAVMGATLVDVRMEKLIPKGTTNFAVPSLQLTGAKSERGYVVLAAEEGVRLKPENPSGLREVHTGSAPVRVKGAQQAYRFTTPGWKLAMALERAATSIHSEVFHLVSLGEGIAYCSVAITYHVAGAPVQEFKLVVPPEFRSLEFTGSDIEGWTREGKTCTVRLQARVMGDYTLLVTYERPVADKGADLSMGEVETVGTDSEVGYIAVASSLGLKVRGPTPPPSSLIEIDRHEIPPAYAAPVSQPILAAYKILRAPHAVAVKIETYDTERLLGQIADYAKVTTEISKDGEATTTANYFIKNASRQFLVVSLPPGVDLWSIKRVAEDGSKEDVLSQKSGEGLLIPVSRPVDPNTAIEIEVTFAQQHRRLGFWRTGLAPLNLVVPVLPDTQAAFASWTVRVPPRFAIGESGGSMTPELQTAGRGLVRLAGQARNVVLAILDGPGRRTLRAALFADMHDVSSTEFTRAVNLTGDKPLSLSLWVVPEGMGRNSSAIVMLVALAAGILVGASAVAGRWRAVRIAIALTLLVTGLAQAAEGRAVMTGGGIAFVSIFVVCLIILRGFPGLWRLVRALSGRRERTRGGAGSEPPPLPPPFEPDEPAGTQSGKAGRAMPVLLGMIALAALGVHAVLAVEPPATQQVAVACMPAESNPVVVASVELTIEAPKSTGDVEASAAVTAVLSFETEKPVSFPVIARGGVLTSSTLGSRDLEIASTADGYVLRATDDGTFKVTLKYRVPVAEKDGVRSITILVPDNLKNSAKLRVPDTELDVASEAAVLLRPLEKQGSTEVEAVFGPARLATLSWHPRARRKTLEQTLFFAEVNTYAVLQSGVVDLVNVIRYQVAQGELREFRMKAPAGMTVTSVEGQGIVTWSFDPETRMIAAISDKPLSGNFTLTVVTQIASEGLPYGATLGVPEVMGTALQRGTLAVAAPDSIQVRLDEAKGLDAVNAEDFAAEASAATGRLTNRGKEAATVRRAFRYQHAAEVSATVHAEQVLPEIRVAESGSLSIADERIVLSTKLTLDITRSGVFGVTLEAPADFEVETLTGKDVSHWDELGAGAPAAATNDKTARRQIAVYFNGRVLGGTDLNLVLNRSERGIEQRILVPRVAVKDARKHNGKLTVSGERGVKTMVETQEGVDIKKASEEGIRQADVLVFEILRPEWSLVLKTEVMAPVLKPEVLHWVDLSEGMLQCRLYLMYKIENAGVKTFRLRSPVPGATLSVTGRNIARVQEMNKAEGIWEVDLHNKVEDQYAMTASFQIPYNPDEKEVLIRPLQTLDTEGQRGYLVVTCGGRVQVRPKGEPAGLRAEDSRGIPPAFGAGDLSSAIQCYRTLGPDYRLTLSVIRHDSAGVLPASIDQVRMTSALSPDREALTRVQLDMTVGGLRFLRVALPTAGDKLWTVTVNGKAVAASRDKELYCIPLEEQEADERTTVEFLYAGRAGGSLFGSTRRYDAPTFPGLPLRDIEWIFYACPGLAYWDFGGTLDLDTSQGNGYRSFDADSYWGWNKDQRVASLQKAKEGLTQGGQLARAGKQKRARQALQQALTYSQAENDLNEDARVQLRNLVKRQVKMGLVNRRDAVRFSRNIFDEQQLGQMKGFQNGEYTEDYVVNVEKKLSAKDNGVLDTVAEKLIDQQAAAAGVVNAITVVMPEHGRPMRFYRALQIDPESKSYVTFKVSSGRLMGWVKSGALAAALLVLFWWLAARIGRRATVAAR